MLVTLKGKKLMSEWWKQGQIPSEGYRDEVQLCRDGVKKAKVKTKLNLTRDVKKHERSSINMLTRKGRSKEAYPPIKNSGSNR